MPAHGQNARTFSTPSPGELLKRQPKRLSIAPEDASAHRARDTELPGDPFRANVHTAALIERGVVLAPLLVQWHYRVAAARPFAKWLKTKDIILADARLGINEHTSGVHYFGTYVAAAEAPTGSGAKDESAGPVACQTLWGFTSKEAMHHMFELCRGKVERVSIVETDLRDFVAGLKAHIGEAGSEHFSQSVLVAPAAL